MNNVEMMAGVVRGEEVIEYPTDVIYLRGVNHGNVQVIEYFSTDRSGPPLHAHAWDEIEIVVDGVVEFHVGNETVSGGPGTVQFLPAGIPHAVRVPDGEARLIYVTIGPPYDQFARDMARMLADGSPMAEVAARAADHGVRLVGKTDSGRLGPASTAG